MHVNRTVIVLILLENCVNWKHKSEKNYRMDKSEPLLIQRINNKQQTPFYALCANENRLNKFEHLNSFIFAS